MVLLPDLTVTFFVKCKKRRYHSDLFCRLHYSRGSLEWYPFECYLKDDTQTLDEVVVVALERRRK